MVEKRDIIDAVFGFILMLLGFIIGFMGSLCVGPQPHLCHLSNIMDILDLLMFKVSYWALPLIYIILAVDLIFTKKIFADRKRFIYLFVVIIIIHTGIAFVYGCSSHCTFDVDRVDWKLPRFEDNIRMNILQASRYGVTRPTTWDLDFIDKLCFRKPFTIEMYSGDQLMEVTGTTEIIFSDPSKNTSIELEEDPLCFESKDGIFKVRLEGLGDRTKISRP